MIYDEGKLKPPQTYFWERKPPEELYDLQNDPDEVKNLVSSPEHQGILSELRQAHRQHVLQVCDVGFLSEAEQHSRAARMTMYEMSHNSSQYPLERILAMADAALLLKSDALPQLKEGLKDSDSAIRYWAAMGILRQGAPAVDVTRDYLRLALRDASPTVRITVARALGQYGTEADLTLDLPILKELASPDKNEAYVSMLDLNAIDALGKKAAPLMDTLKNMPTQDPSAVARANSYVPRLVENLTGTPNTNAPTANKRTGKKK